MAEEKTTDEMWRALKRLCWNAHLTTDIDGGWFVFLPGVEISDGRLLRLGALGVAHSATPEEAIAAAFRRATELGPEEKLVMNAGDLAARRCVRWNGFMWREVAELALRG